MRALTVRQPWAWAIVHGGKDVENRTRNLAGSYRGPVAIHAGLARFEQDNLASRAHRAAHGSEVPTELVFGAFIGVVNLWAVHPDQDGGRCCPNVSDRHQLGDARPADWTMRDHWHLCLSNPRPLAQPIPAKGKLGLWAPTDDVVAQIHEQLAARATQGDSEGVRA